MKQNIGTADRVFRLLMASALLIYAFLQHSWLAAAFGCFVLYEAGAGWCIYYQLIGKSSCPIPDEKQTASKATSIVMLIIYIFICLGIFFWFAKEFGLWTVSTAY